jgi:cytidylate kinase
MGKVITIDGPAASGKSTVSRELARRLGWQWVSTGAFYRGLAFAASEKGLSIENENEIAKLADSDEWYIDMTSERTEVFYLGQKVTDLIAQDSIGSLASQISKYPKVREKLLSAQRECQIKSIGLVAEGRDCGTIVFPDANLKIYLTADQNQRAERRAKELGMAVNIMAESQKKRDDQDINRKVAPLQIPFNALVVDTTEMSLDQVVRKIEEVIQKENFK